MVVLLEPVRGTPGSGVGPFAMESSRSFNPIRVGVLKNKGGHMLFTQCSFLILKDLFIGRELRE